MSEKRSQDVAQAKAARLLRKTNSVSSMQSDGQPTAPSPRRHVGRGGYAGSVSTVVSRVEPHHLDDDVIAPPVQYENSYRMEPTKRFPTRQIEDIIQDCLSTNLDAESKYDPDHCRDLTKELSEVIRSRVKEHVLPRYKIVCVVNVGQINSQGIQMGSRCLWNSKHDNFASSSYKNGALFAVADVYGIYYE